MNTQTITFYIFVMVSLFPMTAYGDFYNDVSNAYLPGEVKSIMVGEAEAPIVEVEAKTPLSLGTAIILTEPFPSSLTLAEGNSLADLLAEKGWHVVISPVNLPMAPISSVDKAVAENDAAQDSQADKNIHPRSNQLTQYLNFESATSALTLQLNALNNYLQTRSGYRMIIAQGMLATTYFSAAELQPALHPDTFVAISPFWPEDTTNNLLIETMAKAEYPVLDLSLSEFNDWEASTTLKRKIRAKNELKIHYRQITIPSNSLAFSIKEIQKNPQIQMVANSTIGWTRHLGW
ncbi:DUF3530 family protein [Alteromonas sp. IB21]|uniref:DUF3530 family protein n=1 Tax=Alteromonas sp. IB21 TaxID=2779369 RepID=UPI0018E7C15D|nr:DUF3530 family protein [Alteromonas sp. IB21]MBJ2128237.1 DUF3530 family protein [Alteromonas sp. IB21]